MFGYTAHKTGSKTVSTFLNRLLAMRMADQARLWLPPRLLCVSLRICESNFLLRTGCGWLFLQAVQKAQHMHADPGRDITHCFQSLLCMMYHEHRGLVMCLIWQWSHAGTALTQF